MNDAWVITATLMILKQQQEPHSLSSCTVLRHQPYHQWAVLGFAGWRQQ